MFRFKKVKYGVLIALFLLVSFSSSYYFFINTSNKEKANTKKWERTSSVNSKNYTSTDGLKEEKINKDTKIIFQIEYKKSGDIIEEKNNEDLTSLIGKNKKDTEAIFRSKGYIVKEMDEKQLVLLKSYNRYSPEKYVLDIYEKGNCMAIFKTDVEGNESIEDPDNDIKYDKKVSDIKEVDIETIKQGRKTLQFDTREEAEDSYKALFNS